MGDVIKPLNTVTEWEDYPPIKGNMVPSLPTEREHSPTLEVTIYIIAVVKGLFEIMFE